MASNATIFKATLHIADMDQHYYEDHAVTLARHPSETDERMMIRLLAFALHAHETLAFGRGIGTEDEPALWQKDLTGAIDLWIEVGEPDEKLIRRACGRARQVAVYSYGGRGADQWWEGIRPSISRYRNLTIMNIPQSESRALAQLAQRSMDLHCSIQEGQIMMGDDTHAVHVALAAMHPAAT